MAMVYYDGKNQEERHMALIQWTPEFSVGVEKFDEQHKKLFSLINELHGAIQQGRGPETLQGVLSSLADYVKTHFTEEEALMEKYRFPHLSAHRSEHKKLAAQVAKLQVWRKTSDTLLSPVVMEFLLNWLSNHIQKTDMRYKPFLNDLGVH
jgi:hemerythrin